MVSPLSALYSLHTFSKRKAGVKGYYDIIAVYSFFNAS
jgi:hypothetical protein